MILNPNIDYIEDFIRLNFNLAIFNSSMVCYILFKYY